MDDRPISTMQPYPVDVIEGKKYFLCTCGHSAKLPFCDGSHSSTSFLPEMYTANKTRTVLFCGCRHTNRLPLCDGTHSKL